MSSNSRYKLFHPQFASQLPDIDYSKIDWTNPASFFNALMAGGPEGIRKAELVSYAQAESEARSRSENIFHNWSLLRKILERHELTIHKRWTKKSRAQRVKVLLAAWPNMSAGHRPDFIAFRKESEQQRKMGTKFREAYIWPQINLEDLSAPKTLLLFLQARARNHPHLFVHADKDMPRLGHVTKAILHRFMNGYTMKFMDRSAPQLYVELIPWSDNDKAFQMIISERGMLIGQGLTVLEIQERIMQFLVDCCKSIMHDVTADDLASDKFPVQPPAVLAEDTVNGFASLPIMAAERPYRLPSNMDLVRLESLFEAQKSAAEDHIWALREDPDYYANCISTYREHRQEMLQETSGEDYPVRKPGHEDIFWTRIISQMVTTAHVQLETWSELHSQTKTLLALQSKHASDLSDEKYIPIEFAEALLKFLHYLRRATRGQLVVLGYAVVSSPPFRPFFVRFHPQDPNASTYEIGQREDVEMDSVQKHLMWLLQTMWEDGTDLFVLGLTHVVDEIESLIQREPKAKAMLSPYIIGKMSDLSVIVEATRQVVAYQPWMENSESLPLEKKKATREEFASRTRTWAALALSSEELLKEDLVRLGKPEGAKFYYPAEKRRTRDTVEAMRWAEAHLDAFWAAVDKQIRSRLGDKLEDTALWRILSKTNSLSRTRAWSDAPKVAETPEVETITVPLSELYLDRELRTERTIDRTSWRTSPSTKAKTRGTPAPSAPLNNPATPPSDGKADTQPTFELDMRAYKVFRSLFYVPSLSATPGEVPWTDFLHAMVSTGFEPQKLYGSVWLFSPKRMDAERSIQFHEPHPLKKLPYKMARRFGRRLNRAYGWEGSMFKLKD